MNTRIILCWVLISLFSVIGYSQDAGNIKTGQNNWFIETGANIHFYGDENDKYDGNCWKLKNTVGYKINDNLYAGIMLSFSNNGNFVNNERIYHIYLDDSFCDYLSSRIVDRRGHSLGASPFIRKKYNLLNKLCMNLDFGIGFDFSNKTIMVENAWDGVLWHLYSAGTKTNISASAYINYGFIYQFHKNLGLTIRFSGFELEYEKLEVDFTYGIQEIKSTNISLFKNIHEPYVGFIFYF